MPELTQNNLQAFDNDGEQRFLELAISKVKETLISVLNLTSEETFDNYYTEKQIHEFTKLGIKRARGHRLVNVGEILDYLWLMCWLGAYFDIDAHYKFLHPHINPNDDQLKQGITVHATFNGSRYIKILNTPIDAPLERLKGVRYDMLKSEKNNIQSKAGKDSLLDKTTLINTVKYYMPTNKAILNDDDLIQEIYAQSQPHSLGFKTRNSHIAWFMMTVEKGYRFYDNPLYMNIPEIIGSNEQKRKVNSDENDEANKITQIIDVLISKSAK